MNPALNIVPLMLRTARSVDQAYVTNSWISSMLGARPSWGAKGVELNEQVDRLLSDPRTSVYVACPAVDIDRIVGWIATAKMPGTYVLEFVHVRRQRRREGIAKMLLHRAGILNADGPRVYLYQTSDGDAFMRRTMPNAIHVEAGEFV